MLFRLAQVDGHDGPNSGHRRKFVGAPNLGVLQASKSRRTSGAFGGLAGEKICEKYQSSSAKFRYRSSLFALRQAIGIGDVARLVGMRLGHDRVVLNAKS